MANSYIRAIRSCKKHGSGNCPNCGLLTSGSNNVAVGADSGKKIDPLLGLIVAGAGIIGVITVLDFIKERSSII